MLKPIAYGTGIRRIFALYADCPITPAIDVTQNSFKMTLPNMNAVNGNWRAKSDSITPQMQTVLDFLSNYGKISDLELQKLLNIKRTRAFTLAKQMVDAGLIKIKGRGSDRRITL